ncbi:uncharacterized protein LOC133801276 [Humulus lupulus]|uniref:uncharacterized protein LOC133801276 n=1 Tax=Humulus lupulus TaxID=3486 RepID=UPI002B412202|nr:uncharacterized protein LOC133801276 [Humulus lupulus]
MAGRYDHNQFAAEEEVNPFSNPGTAATARDSRLSPLPPEPVDFNYGQGSTVDIPMDSNKDLRKKEKELQEKEAELRSVFQHLHTNNAKTKEVAWRTVKCPRQPLQSVQCGFYVMRMMKDFVTNEFSMRWLTSNCGGKKSYRKDEINEVREEWAQCVMDLMSTT